MPSAKDPAAKRLKKKMDEARILVPESERVVSSLLPEIVGVLRDHGSDVVLASIARVAFELDPTKAEDAPVLAAFSAAGLDHKNLRHWRKLLEIFCDVHFAKSKTKPVTWDMVALIDVANDYFIEKKAHPKLKHQELCKKLHKKHKDKYGDYNFDSFRKIVRKAINPNTMPVLRYPSMKDPLLKIMRAQYEKDGVVWTPELEKVLVNIVSAIDFEALGRI
jgi:hypothetical protein